MTRARGELPEPEEFLLGIERESPEEEAAREKRAAEEAEVRRAFMVGLIKNPLFREWLMGVLTEFNTFGRSFGVSPAGFPDDRATEYYLGMKAAGWRLWEQFDDLAPEMASLMRREAAGKV